MIEHGRVMEGGDDSGVGLAPVGRYLRHYPTRMGEFTGNSRVKLQRLQTSAVPFCLLRQGVTTFNHPLPSLANTITETVFRGARWATRDVHPSKCRWSLSPRV